MLFCLLWTRQKTETYISGKLIYILNLLTYIFILTDLTEEE